MKYFTLQTVKDAYKANIATTKNKFWGLLSILSSIDDTIVEPGISYDFDTTKVSEFLENLFCLEDIKKSYAGSSTWNIMLSSKWTTKVSEQMLYITPNIYDIVAWYFRAAAFDDTINDTELVKLFLEHTHISIEDAQILFDFTHKAVQYSPSLYTEKDLYNQLEISGKNITAEGNSVVAHPGELSRAPFIQTLYASQGTLECLIITPFKFSDMYGGGKTAKTKEIHELQKIYFGAPGSGKSYKVNTLTQGQSVIRTTFHPDTDYATFIGSYKPKMDGRNITYGFVKQAFLKAYLSAWKEFAGQSSPSTRKSFTNTNGTYTIKDIQNDCVLYDRVYVHKKSTVCRIWGKSIYWAGDIYTIPSATRSGASTAEAICDWIFKKVGKVDFETGWNEFLSELKSNETLRWKASTQEYVFSASSNDEEVVVNTYSSRSTRDTIQKEFVNEESTSNSIAAGVANILKEIDPDDFNNAWKKMKDGLYSIVPDIVMPKPVFLIIEEINRGNCAQIFGDIFQLLDRQKDGFSVYPIESDSDIQKAIYDAFSFENEYKLSNNISIDFVAHGYKNDASSTLSADIANGRVMLLPPNLYILATMNTSDQSLFPMDSAFKRRWAWEYVPINAECPDSQFKITIGEGASKKTYKWASFLTLVNERIHNLSDSEDKQMGNFFIKSDIDVEEFKSKVMFYLWSEVCKEYEKSGSFFKYRNSEGEEVEFTFNSLFPTNGESNKRLQGFMDYLGVEEA